MSHYNDFSNSNSNPRDNTTPKRKLSFNRRATDLNGSITSIQYSAAKTTSSNENSPFIKRKRMPKVESCRSFDLESPQYLNQGLESLKLATNEQSAKNSPMRSTKRSNKLIRHRSGPLTQLNLNKYLNNAQNNNLDDERIGEEEKPVTTKSSEKEEKPKDEFDSESESKIDDLEDLLFGDRAPRKNEESSNAEHHEIIKHSLEIDATCSNMIGDRSKAHVLPVIPSAKHTDLHCISPETLVNVLNGNFNDQIDEYIIVDSRYPYEYEGGHIHNAMNIFTKDRLFEEMFIKRLRFKCPPSSTNASRSLTTYASTNRLSDFMSEFRKSSRQETSQKRVIIIFHCEFSSERGPGLLRFLRSQDRALNEDCYPYLHYPELYLLEGGYKSFYEHFKNYCDPQMYKPMLHAEHLKDLKHFRAKAKSWEVSRHHIINKFSEKQHGLRKQIRSNLSRVQFNNNDNNNNS